MWSVPSKTFLIGEYYCHHGRALVVNTTPRFEWRKNSLAFWNSDGFRPAARLARLYQHSGQGLEFFDPHDGQGGFGASSAEYLMLAASLNLSDIFHLYRDHTVWQNYRNSGCDLLAQKAGYLCEVGFGQSRVLAKTWPFEDLKLFLVRNGIKLGSHAVPSFFASTLSSDLGLASPRLAKRSKPYPAKALCMLFARRARS